MADKGGTMTGIFLDGGTQQLDYGRLLSSGYHQFLTIWLVMVDGLAGGEQLVYNMYHEEEG